MSAGQSSIDLLALLLPVCSALSLEVLVIPEFRAAVKCGFRAEWLQRLP